MHSPKILAFDIYLGRKQKKNGHYRDAFISIWHKDPEKDGTDDSCGWFIRPRHCNQETIEKIVKALDFEFTRVCEGPEFGDRKYYVGLFMPDGTPNFSPHSIVLNMFFKAIHIHYDHNWEKANKWMQKHLFEILHFAENPVDSLRDSIIGTYRIQWKEPWKRDEQLRNYVTTIYSWIMREERPWYKHPRWHIHHWSIQIHPLQKLKRRFWDKCCVCGKRGTKSHFMSDWNGTKRWHQECDTTNKPIPTEK
jgi:hypothetical protein